MVVDNNIMIMTRRTRAASTKTKLQEQQRLDKKHRQCLKRKKSGNKNNNNDDCLLWNHHRTAMKTTTTLLSMAGAILLHYYYYYYWLFLPRLYVVQGFSLQVLQGTRPTTRRRQNPSLRYRGRYSYLHDDDYQREPPPPPSLRRLATSSSSSLKSSSLLSSSSSWQEDYEYIPPETSLPSTATVDASSSNSSYYYHYHSLPSAYPDGTPSGLRGEAVRSALQSGRCIAWQYETNTDNHSNNDDTDATTSSNGSILSLGLLRLQGKGCRTFGNNKLSQSLETGTPPQQVAASSSNSNKNILMYKVAYKEGALLTAQGRMVDKLGVVVLGNDKHDDDDDDHPKQSAAWMVTSPGHAGPQLYQRWEPTIFPMDQVSLQDWSSRTVAFSVASTRHEHVQDVVDQFLVPLLPKDYAQCSPLPLPSNNDDEASSYALWIPQITTTDNDENNNNDAMALLILPTVHLPSCVALGCTFLFISSSSSSSSTTSSLSNLGHAFWEAATQRAPEGPIAIAAREWETLRIEAGVPRFGREMTAAAEEKKKKKTKKKTNQKPLEQEDTETKSKSTTMNAAASPLELHGQALVDTEKGCYMGQEGIASILKNKRGPPRTLYQVVFPNDSNQFVGGGDSGSGGGDESDNATRWPQAGDALYVLGSNQEIAVGTLTSVGEPGGTGRDVIVALALVRRPDGILAKMSRMDLVFQERSSNIPNTLLAEDVDTGSGIIMPPPMDPLHGLEVIVGDSYTVGTLQSVPARRLPRGQNLFEQEAPDVTSRFIEDFDVTSGGGRGTTVTRVPLGGGAAEGDLYEPASMSSSPLEPVLADDDSTAGIEDSQSMDGDIDQEAMHAAEEELLRAQQEAQAAHAKAEEAAAEAQRKADKMEMLRQRAEEALARRKEKAVQEDPEQDNEKEAKAKASADAEAQRKEAKMEMLRQRAAEALARRKQKSGNSNNN